MPKGYRKATNNTCLYCHYCCARVTDNAIKTNHGVETIKGGRKEYICELDTSIIYYSGHNGAPLMESRTCDHYLMGGGRFRDYEARESPSTDLIVFS